MINNRRLTGYKAAPEDRVRIANAIHDDDSEDDDDYYDDEDDEAEDDDDEDEDEEEDSMSVLSIPDSNIDFDLIYALHTFAATIEGQASVVKGDALTLLDDSNSYWWLIKVLKTSEIGYIPAENIETPHERLARYHAHQNVELALPNHMDIYPARSQTLGGSPGVKKRVTLAKKVKFQAQVIIGLSDDEGDFEEEYEEWNENMQSSDSEESLAKNSMEADDDDYRFYVNQDDDDEARQDRALERPLTEDADQIMRDTFDFENSDTIKISLTPSIARDSDNDISRPQLDPVARLEQILNEGKDKTEKSKLRKLFSRGKEKSPGNMNDNGPKILHVHERPEAKMKEITSMAPMETDDAHQPSTIKVHINSKTLGEIYKEVNVHLNTTAADVIGFLLEKSDIATHDPTTNTRSDYYLTLRGVDKDEYTFTPSDKPLAIYRTLTAHLNTPMPSLRKARRISQLMSGPGGPQTHMGGPSGAPKNDEICFYLNTKTRRSEDKDRLLSIKAVLFASDVSENTGVFRADQSRMDKCIEVSPQVTVADVTLLLLDKFHILNGIVADDSNEDVAESPRSVNSPEIDPVAYRLCVHRNGQEKTLFSKDPIQSAFGNTSLPVHQRRSGNPDRSSISSISSNIVPPREEETYFILRRAQSPKEQVTHLTLDIHDGPFNYPTREPTPMPQKSPARATYTPALNSSYMHQTQQQQQQQQPDSPYTLAINAAQSTFKANDVESQSQVEETHNQNVDVRKEEILTDSTPKNGPESTLPVRPSRAQRPVDELGESLLFCSEEGMSELMVMIRGAARQEGELEKHRRTSAMRNGEVSEVYKESHKILDRLEKDLDQLMTEAVGIYG